MSVIFPSGVVRKLHVMLETGLQNRGIKTISLYRDVSARSNRKTLKNHLHKPVDLSTSRYIHIFARNSRISN